MIVDDFDLHRAAFGPSKANAPLIVDSNAVLASSVAFQRFKPMGRRNKEVGQPRCGYHTLKPHAGSSQYRRGQTSDGAPLEYSFSLPVLELPHEQNITHCVINVKG